MSPIHCQKFSHLRSAIWQRLFQSIQAYLPRNGSHIRMALTLILSFVSVRALSAPIQCKALFSNLATASLSEKFAIGITREQIEKAYQVVDRQMLNQTLFIVPHNDGEAVRANEILQALKAPHLIVSRQAWGATLDKEPISPDDLKNVKRIVVFEMPDVTTEENLRARGFEVTVIDHRFYKDLDRRRQESSIEQLMTLIKWPMSRVDEAIAVNDRGYIPGLKKMGLTKSEIRAIRRYDLIGQGRAPEDIDRLQAQAAALIPHLPRRDGVYIVGPDVKIDSGILKQELAIESLKGQVDTLILKSNAVGFSGRAAVVQKLLAMNFEELGYAPNSYAQYGGGDPQASMFFGFKPNTMWSKLDVIPKSVLKAIEKVIFSNEEALMNHSSIALADDPSSLTADVIRAGMLPRGSALITSAGALEATGIKAIIHAATGSMRLGGGVFEPTLTSVASSVKASLELARAGGHRRVAIPFIGGGIFVERLGVTPQALADLIVTTAIQESNGLELRFVTFGEIDTQLFKNALQKNKSPENAQVVSGSLTDFKIHGASAIVNAANTEAQFGGGVSGVIGRATGRIEEINREAQLKISAWLQSLQLQIKIRAHNQ